MIKKKACDVLVCFDIFGNVAYALVCLSMFKYGNMWLCMLNFILWCCYLILHALKHAGYIYSAFMAAFLEEYPVYLSIAIQHWQPFQKLHFGYNLRDFILPLRKLSLIYSFFKKMLSCSYFDIVRLIRSLIYDTHA